MADRILVAGELEQQSETLKGTVGVFQQDAVGIFFLVQDVLEKFLGDQAS